MVHHSLKALAADREASETAAKAQFLVGWMHLQAQEYGQAKEAFDALTRKFPKSPLAPKAKDLSKRLSKMEQK